MCSYTYIQCMYVFIYRTWETALNVGRSIKDNHPHPPPNGQFHLQNALQTRRLSFPRLLIRTAPKDFPAFQSKPLQPHRSGPRVLRHRRRCTARCGSPAQ